MHIRSDNFNEYSKGLSARAKQLLRNLYHEHHKFLFPEHGLKHKYLKIAELFSV